MRYYFNILIILALLGTIQSAWAQSIIKIQGRVKTTSGQPLTGANVVVVGTGVGVISNHKGNFTIENLFAGEYTLRVSFIGYFDVEKQVIVQKDFVTTVEFVLSQKVINLPGVLVEDVFENPNESAFFETITTIDIRNSPFDNVADLINQVSGIEITENSSGGKLARIRGSNANQVLVLLDDVPLNDPMLGEADLGQVPLSNIEKINIWKSGSHSRVGGAIGGVIEIISKTSAMEEVSVKADLGSYDKFDFRSSISGVLKHANYFVNVYGSSKNGKFSYSYRLPDGTLVRDERLNADLSSRNIFGKIRYSRGEHAVILQLNVQNSNRGIPGLIYSLTPYAEAKNSQSIILARYQFRHHDWSARLQFSNHFNKTEFNHAPPGDAPIHFRTVPPYRSRNQLNSKLAFLELKNGTKLTINASLRKDSFQNEDLLSATNKISKTDNVQGEMGFGTQIKLAYPEFSLGFVLTPAIRVETIQFKRDEFNRTNTYFSPGIGMLLSRTTNWLMQLKSNLSKSFRAPTFADLFYQDFRVSGNPELLPETSRNFDVGIKSGFPILGWLEIEVAYFRNHVENLIIWELGSFATFRPFNTAALLQGYEFSSSWLSWNDKIKLQISHVIDNALNKNKSRTTHNKRLTYRPEHISKINLSVNLGFAALDYHKRLIGERYITAANTVKMPAYTVDDFTMRIRQNVKKTRVSFFLSVFNVFDNKFEIVERAPMPGRHFKVGLEVVY
ncbi:TonB-dependent receptor [candidate division KSB1 bacterium]|nr:TonB-dependent receptor [candidate division KSB1 bacterium]